MHFCDYSQLRPDQYYQWDCKLVPLLGSLRLLLFRVLWVVHKNYNRNWHPQQSSSRAKRHQEGRHRPRAPLVAGALTLRAQGRDRSRASRHAVVKRSRAGLWEARSTGWREWGPPPTNSSLPSSTSKMARMERRVGAWKFRCPGRY